MSTATREEPELEGLLSREQWDKIMNSPEMKEKYEAEVEFFKKVDWNEWEKVFAEAEAEHKKLREEELANSRPSIS